MSMHVFLWRVPCKKRLSLWSFSTDRHITLLIRQHKYSKWFNVTLKSFENWNIKFKKSSPFSLLTHSTWNTVEVVSTLYPGVTRCSMKGKLSFNLFMVHVLCCFASGQTLNWNNVKLKSAFLFSLKFILILQMSFSYSSVWPFGTFN